MDGVWGDERGPEEALAGRWQRAPAGAALTTEEGEVLRVLFPGRRNRGAGPDFQGALLQTERGPVRGDVEVHAESGGWLAHGHHGDRRYDRVVLHVVGRDNGGAPTALRSGRRVPVLVVASHLGSGPAGCGAVMPPEERPWLLALLERLGLLRFRLRVQRWRGRVRSSKGQDGLLDEFLYRALLEAFGYGAARRNFRRIGAAVPWSVLRQAALRQAAGEGRAMVQALLLGAGGLLEGAAPAGVPPAEWEALRRRWEVSGAGAAVAAAAWKGGRWRPRAGPAHGLLAAGALLAAALPGGPAGALAAAAGPDGSPDAVAGTLRRWLQGVASGPPGGPGVIGRGRAAILLVNVLLPFLAAWCPEGGAGFREAYRLHGPLEADAVVRPMTEALGLKGVRLSACRQQGLHHLFRRYCRRGRSGACPVCRGRPG